MINKDDAIRYLRTISYRDDLGQDMDVLEDIIRLIEYLSQTIDRRTDRIMELRARIHSIILH